MTWLLLVLWFEIKHLHKHTQDTQGPMKWHIYKCIITSPVMYTQQLPVLHWMNNLLIQKPILQRSIMSLLFKNYLPVEVIYLLIRFNKTLLTSLTSQTSLFNKFFLWNTKNTDRNGVNEQNTHTPHTQKNITLERVSTS